MRAVIFFSIIFAFGIMQSGLVSARLSNDPYVEQWGYETTNVYDAWDITTGSKDVVVAVIDNGFDHYHPDLIGNVWKNEDEIPRNGIDDDRNGFVDDVFGWNFTVEDTNKNGKIDDEELGGNNNPRPDVSKLSPAELENELYSHGTFVAGIIGAVGNNGRDGAGINWDVRLMNVKVLGNSGGGDLNNLPHAIRYAVNNGADVINISIVGYGFGDELAESLDYAEERGVVVVAAAGNEMINLNNYKQYPVCSDFGSQIQTVVGTSAITEERRIARFSNVGSDCINITAPGVNINSLVRFSPKDDLHETYGYGWRGTSFAAPYVAGAAALVKSIQPTWGVAQIHDALFRTVHHTLGQDEEVYANLFGVGLLQIDKAVAFAASQPGARIFSRKQRLLAYDGRTGAVQEYNISTGEVTRYARGMFKNIDDLRPYYDHDGVLHFVLAHEVSGETEILLLNRRMRILRTWRIPRTGKVRVAAGYITNPREIEVAVAPQYADDQVVEIFDVRGAHVDQYSIRGVHNGVSLALTTLTGGLQQLVALYGNEQGYSVARFDEHLVPQDVLPVPDFADGGSITVADVDADGEDEFVLGSGPGFNSKLSYYEFNGHLKRAFGGFDPGFTGGMQVQTIDYDLDGRDDVVISPQTGDKPTRVWNGRSKRLFEWRPFEQEPNTRYTMLSIVE